MRSFRNVRVEVSELVAVITIDRPSVRNALDRETIAEVTAAFEELRVREDVQAVIVTGGGDRVFVAGRDIRDLQKATRDDALAAFGSTLYGVVERFPKPTIAAINGHAMGGGCELALACDLRIAAEHVKFGQPEVALGIIPAAGGTQRLPRVIGLGRAAQMILTGDPIDAQTALAWGLVSQVVPVADLLPAARRLADRILSRSPLAVRLAKLALSASSRVDLDSGLLIETLAQAVCYQGEDRVEGTSAFLEKRAPSFQRQSTECKSTEEDTWKR